MRELDAMPSVSRDGGPILVSPPGRHSSVQPVSFSTRELPVEEQFEAWREHCQSVVELTPVSDAGYAASFRIWSFGHFALRSVLAPAFRFRRTPVQIRRDSLDLWQIMVLRRGSLRVQIEEGEFSVPAGVPHILSLDRPFAGECTDAEWFCLFVSRDAFPSLGPTIDACRAAPLAHAMGELLGQYIQSLADSLETMTEAELPRAAEATRAMIAACVAPSASAALGAEAHVEHARLGRIRQIIRQNLRSTRLGPERLCKLAGVSRSQLYRLFEPFGGVARYIQGERLRQAHQALSDPSSTRDIIKIAEDFGFFDPSAFSRAFRREFEYSPSQLRQMAQSGWVAAPIRRDVGQQSRHDLASVLRLI